ncbi:MAG: type I-B CRISPR-associated protein Cas7/Cst2/DevR [Candidatus Aenigmarchaeota archaeon]|nr:type I-B CRISPR-associated protein Cas7/Cst2/DevR [Candidatus Aenigmarchaeota archaeon]
MKVAQISVLARISGNVNADEVIGTRITLKKMYSSSGEVLPFVSARAIKYAIRQALKEHKFDVDPFIENPDAEEALRLCDSGDPVKYIDNDLFGYMVTLGRGKTARRRQGPIAFSYLKALRDTPIKSEFAARFPRPWSKKLEENPVPFEVEVAEFIGKVNCLMNENIGIFEEIELKGKDELKNNLLHREINGKKVFMLDDKERRKRIEAFLYVFLTPSYVLPRRTNSLNVPEYIAALIALSSRGPLPIYQYLTFDFDKNQICIDGLKSLIARPEISSNDTRFFLIDYTNRLESSIPEKIEMISVSKVIDKISKFFAVTN